MLLQKFFSVVGTNMRKINGVIGHYCRKFARSYTYTAGILRIILIKRCILKVLLKVKLGT